MKWKTFKIDEIKAKGKYTLVGGPFGSNLTTRDYVEEGIPVLRGSNLSTQLRFTHENLVFVSEEKAKNLTPNLAFPKDVLFTQRGTLGQVGLIPEGFYEKYVVSQSQMKLTVNPEMALPEFVYYFFSTEEGRRNLEAHSITSGVPHINLGILKNLEINLPPLPTQQKIASILSAYDDLIENNLKRIRLLEEAVQHLYREWFVKFRFPGWEAVRVVDGLPDGWERKTIGQVCETIGGGTPSTKEPKFWDGGEIIWFSPTDLSKNSSLVLLDSSSKITEEGLKNSSAKMLPPRTILMSSRATIGLFGIISKPCSTNQGFISIIPNEEQMRYYLLFNLMNRKQEIIGKANGSTFKEISKKTFREMEVLRPLNNLLWGYSQVCEPIINQIEILEKQNQRLKEARDLLLPRLMNQSIEI